jgi:hypothetical protein
MHPNYILNGPSNRVMRKEQLVAMLAKGQMASEGFERTIEATSITGNIGIVMGRETVTPAADSQLGRQFGSKIACPAVYQRIPLGARQVAIPCAASNGGSRSVASRTFDRICRMSAFHP